MSQIFLCLFTVRRNARHLRPSPTPARHLRPYIARPVASQPGGGGGLNLVGWNTRRTPPWTLSAWRHQFEKRPHSWTFTSTPPWTLPVWRHQFEKRPHSWTFTSTPPWTLPVWRHQFEKRPHSWTFTSTPPWTLPVWRHQFEKRPHSWTFTSTPPLDIARVTSSTYSKGGTKLLKGGTKLLKGGTKLLKGGTKLLKGGTKLLKGGTKLLKGGTKLLKGGTKSLGWATGGGGVVRPPRPPPLATGLIADYARAGTGDTWLSLHGVDSRRKSTTPIVGRYLSRNDQGQASWLLKTRLFTKWTIHP